jgi:serine/threonine protein kinase
MPAFRYKHGDRPLDGYTIERGVGRGGFGEVYYALSDSGREVALKIIQGYEQIELRGVSQCMNLKSPHLVTIFDVRHNPDGIPFVIMEYVNGPSLRELIDQQPAGLGVQKAAFFLREIGKGLTFLHDCGIVHRDLKPGNIFYENGYVKIGDYGLSKAMSASQHSGQTMTVGTVHYMAPEIGLGKYDRSIDIYAMGAVLFELITGQVPYLGASAGEILMKHMSSEPNVQGIEEPFATCIKRAMAKDPAVRYQTIQEMVEAVFGAEHVRDSVSGFSPGDLSMVAGRVAARIAVGVGGSSGPPMPPAPPVAPDSWQNAAFADRPNRVAGLTTPPPLPIPQLPSPVPPMRQAGPAASPVIKPDPIPSSQRHGLAWATIFAIALAAGLTAPQNEYFPWMFFSLASMAAALVGIIVGRRFILPKVPPHATFVARLSLGGPAALFALIAATPAFAMVGGHASDELGHTSLGLILPIALLNWIKWTGAHRVKRVSLGIAFTAAASGLLMTAISGGSSQLGIAILAGIALASSVLFPWEPRMFVPAPAAQPTAQPAGIVPAGLLAGLRSMSSGEAINSQQRPLQYAPASARFRPVPDFVPWIWRGAMALLIALGPVLIVTAESNDPRFTNQAFMLQRAVGVGIIVLGVLCFLQSLRRRITSWWSYLIKPLVLFTCLQIILLSAFTLGTNGVESGTQAFAIFFIIFPAIMFLTLLFVKTKEPRAAAFAGYSPAGSPPPLPRNIGDTSSADLQGRPLTSPTPSTFAQTPTQFQPSPQPRPEKLSLLAAFIGSAFHTATCVIAVATALNIAGLIDSGIVDQRLASDMRANLGPNWVRLAHLQGYILTFVGSFLATLFFMLARRSKGVAHMLRPIFAAACFLIAMAMLDNSLGSATWTPVTKDKPAQVTDAAHPRRADVGESIVKYLEASQAKMSIMSLVFAMCGLALLLWPAPQAKINSNFEREGGVA